MHVHGRGSFVTYKCTSILYSPVVVMDFKEQGNDSLWTVSKFVV